MVDEVLKGHKISASSRALVPKMLHAIARGGNKAATLRRKELEQISHLAVRLWESVESPEIMVSNPSPAGNLEGSLGPQPPVPLGNGRSLSVADQPEVPSADLPRPGIDDQLALPPLSATSSMDLAHTFDFSQEQMLFLANHLDDDGLPSMLEFGDQGLNEWI